MSPEVIVSDFPAMGGSVELQLPAGRERDGAAVRALFEDYEGALSRFIPGSELCALNASAGAPFAASPLLFDAVSDAVGWACITDGVFDPSIIDVLEASGYDRPFDDIGRGRTATLARTPVRRGNWRAIAFDYDASAITLPADVRIDLGGLGKGYTVDRAAALLGRGANALVNASGDLFAAGDGPDGDGWYIGVQHPFAPTEDIATLNVNDRAVATSGSVRRRWPVGDRYEHHLIDTRQQRCSQSDLLTVTAIAVTATQADVLAKTAYLLGSRAGLRFIERFDGAECVAVTIDGALLATSGMAEFYA